LGNKGKDGITFLVKTKKEEYAMKTFNDKKSANSIKKESELQKIASQFGIAPKIYDVNLEEKYIVMEKMDCHLFQKLLENRKYLNKKRQYEILRLFKKLDEAKVFHNDSNFLNYMIKNDQIYIIDYGFARKINPYLINQLKTNTPNIKLSLLAFILKLQEKKFDSYNYKYLLPYIVS
jgi:tRNA A-37 threonylcarbamoyl transferase component Bud32